MLRRRRLGTLFTRTLFGSHPDPNLVEFARRLMAGAPRRTTIDAPKAVLRFDFRDRLGRVTLPTLVLFGSNDRSVKPEHTQAAVLYDHHLVIWGSEQAEVAGERLAVATEVVDLAERIGDRALALRGRGLRRTDLVELGDLAGFDDDLVAAEQTAERLRQLRYRWQLPLAHATRALLAGHFAEAEEQASQGVAVGRRAGDQAVEMYYAGCVATLRFMQGRWGEMVELIQGPGAHFPAMVVFRTALASALAEADRPLEARAEVEWLAAGTFAHAAEIAARLQARPMIARSHEGQARALLALDRPGDRQQAAALLGEVVATAEELGIHGQGSAPTPCSRRWGHRRRRPGRPG